MSRVNRMWKDWCGNLRFGGRSGRDRRRLIRRDGMWVRMRLVVHNAPTNHSAYLNLYPMKPKLVRRWTGHKWVHLSKLRDVRRCYAYRDGGRPYHIWITSWDISSDPGAMASMWNIQNYFQNHTWQVRIPIASVSPSSSVARVPTGASLFLPVYQDLVDLRRAYGNHDCQELTISM